MTTAAAIDAALDAEQSPRAIARFFNIPVSQVMARARLKISPFEIERRRLEAAELEKRRIEREKARDARAMAAAEADRLARRDKIDAWLNLPVGLEDDPRSLREVSRGRVYRPEHAQTLGGVVSYETREAA